MDRLSRTDQQRMQLAVALVYGPDLLVLDEPFAGLDPITELSRLTGAIESMFKFLWSERWTGAEGLP